MYNTNVKEIVQKFDRLYEFYSVGPIQKILFEQMVEEIVTMCAQVANDAGLARIPISELPNLIIEEFGFKQPKK